jgi:small subunit ribosomal protein S2
MNTIDKMGTNGTMDVLSKREKLQIARQRAKLEKTLGSIADLTRLPAAMFVVDINKEHIAVREAKRLNIPVFAIVDTNSNPNLVDFPIPANDDASASVGLIVDVLVGSIKEGLNERKVEREKDADNKKTAKKETAKKEVEIAPEVKEDAKVVVEEVAEVKEAAPKKAAAKKAPAKKAAAKKPAAKKPAAKKAEEKTEDKE